MESDMSEAAETKTFRLSKRLSVEITAGPGGFVCEWSATKKLTNRELRRYRAAREEMLQRLSEKIGGKVLVLEMQR
jgi:hypothetical protein